MERGLSRVVKKLVSTMDLPADAILDLPRITMIGNTEMLIENHKGIEKYTSTDIRVRVKDGQMCISGRKLAIRFIDRDDLKLEGVITGIEIVGQ
ncbi:MAG TPA: sporulation protein YqfC [Firmicutes bacterium]|nr:sporulation protein YqfC [Bacillota bacterium]